MFDIDTLLQLVVVGVEGVEVGVVDSHMLEGIHIHMDKQVVGNSSMHRLVGLSNTLRHLMVSRHRMLMVLLLMVERQMLQELLKAMVSQILLLVRPCCSSKHHSCKLDRMIVVVAVVVVGEHRREMVLNLRH